MAASFCYPKHFSRHTAAMAQLVERTTTTTDESSDFSTANRLKTDGNVKCPGGRGYPFKRMSLVTGDVARQ